jgi:hypothetical protein
MPPADGAPGVAVLATDRVILLRYSRDGDPRRGSGLRVGGRFILTADHCAKGTDHRVEVSGDVFPCTVHVRSENAGVDLALLIASDLPPVDPLRCASVNRSVAAELGDCQVLGFPKWKDGADGPRIAQADGYVPTAEGIDPSMPPRPAPLMTLKVTTPLIRDKPVLKGDLDQPGSQWAGMSGAVVVTQGDLIVGVVRSHAAVEGMGSLTVTPLTAIHDLPMESAARMWAALWVPDPSQLPVLPSASSTKVTELKQPKMRVKTIISNQGRSERILEIFDDELAARWIEGSWGA